MANSLSHCKSRSCQLLFNSAATPHKELNINHKSYSCYKKVIASLGQGLEQGKPATKKGTHLSE